MQSLLFSFIVLAVGTFISTVTADSVRLVDSAQMILDTDDL